MYIDIHVQNHYSCQILMKSEFFDRFSKILKHQISWKYILWELVIQSRQMDRETDVTELTVTFHNVANMHKSKC